jgi:hypothetical protein
VNDDDIDHRLSADARRWRDDRPASVPLGMALSGLSEFHARQRGRHSVLLSLLAIAAVIAVAVVALTLLSVWAGDNSGSRDLSPVPSTSAPLLNR